jgi:peptidoglycan-associated lipoprotein
MQMQSRARKPRLLSLWALMLAALLVAGCSSTQTTEPAPEQAPVEDAPAPQPIQETTQDVSDFDGNVPIDANGRPLARTFYFEYDKAVLKPNDLAALEVHAQILRRNPARSVVVEGHCDERGTREYNLALGERRADSVRSFLLSAGVSARQLETVSYGEERPEDAGHSEAAWARNRRAILSYR